MLMDLGQLDVPYFGAGMIVRDDYATANAALWSSSCGPTCAGWRRRAPSRSGDRGAGEVFPHRRPGGAARSYDAYAPTWSRDQLVPEAAIVAQLQASDRPAAKTAPPTDFYDNRYLERIEQSGFLDSPSPAAERIPHLAAAPPDSWRSSAVKLIGEAR